MSHAGFAARVLVQAALLCLLWPAQAVAARLGSRFAGRIPVLFHCAFLRLFGIRVAVRGRPPEPGRPTLVIANHVSWLDIPVMGSLAPLSFVAKSEVAGWPVVGTLARLQRCVFLDRASRTATARVNREVAERLAEGEAILLYPEGTTGDGNRLLPFRSSLVGAARAALADTAGAAVLLQPLAIAYTRRHGLPITRRERPDIAWYGDMELAPHALALFSAGPLDVALTWGEPIAFGPGDDRKRATREAERAVGAALARMNEAG